MPKFEYGVSKILVCLDKYPDHYSKTSSGFGSKYPGLEYSQVLIEIFEDFQTSVKELLGSSDNNLVEMANEMEFDKGAIIKGRFNSFGIEISEDEAENLQLIEIPKGYGYVLATGYCGSEELILISPKGEVSIYRGK